MFGCLVAGKAVFDSPTPVSDTQCVFMLPYPANEVHHLVVFMAKPLPPAASGIALAASVYLGYSEAGKSETNWLYLGNLVTEKTKFVFALNCSNSSSPYAPSIRTLKIADLIFSVSALFGVRNLKLVLPHKAKKQ